MLCAHVRRSFAVWCGGESVRCVRAAVHGGQREGSDFHYNEVEVAEERVTPLVAPAIRNPFSYDCDWNGTWYRIIRVCCSRARACEAAS